MTKELKEIIKHLSPADLKPLYAYLISSIDEELLEAALEKYEITDHKDIKAGFSYSSVELDDFLSTPDSFEKMKITKMILSDLEEIIAALLSEKAVADAYYFAADFNMMINITSAFRSEDFLEERIKELSNLGFDALFHLISGSDEAIRRTFYQILFESMDHFSTIEMVASAAFIRRILESNLNEEFIEELEKTYKHFENSGSKDWIYTHQNLLATKMYYLEHYIDGSEDELKDWKKKYKL